MKALRVSATDIDALRYYMGHEEAELSDLLARLRRQSPPTDAMMAGTALHDALEHAEPGEFETLSAQGYAFDFSQAQGELDIPAIREMKATREYLVDDCTVTLVGKVDATRGRTVWDHKFTGGFDPERFLSSYQWRIYLEIFGADEFRWNVFEGREKGEASKLYVVRNVHALRMHRYPGMDEDVESALAEFVRFARMHLPEKFEVAA